MSIIGRLKAKTRTDQDIFLVKANESFLRNEAGSLVQISAFTRKNAKHQAKQRFGSEVDVHLHQAATR